MYTREGEREREKNKLFSFLYKKKKRDGSCGNIYLKKAGRKVFAPASAA